MSSSLTVLQLLGAPSGWGGAERVALDLAIGLRKSGHRVLFVAAAPEVVERTREAGFEALPVAVRSRWIPGTIMRLASIMKREGVEIAHCHGRRAALVGMPAALAAGVPARIIHVHSTATAGGSEIISKASFGCLGRLAHRIIYCSRQAEKETQGGPSPRSVVIPNGVQFPDTFPQRESRSQHVPLIVAVGRLQRPKGYPILLRALPRVLAALPRVRVKVAGEGEQREELESLRAEMRLGEVVEFAGFVRDVPGLLGQASLFVMPSLWEALPLALLEAVAAGVPVVASAVGAIPEVISDGETGWLVPPGDPEALAAAIVEALRSPAEATKRAEKAFEVVRSKYSVDAMVDAVEHLYEELVGSA